MSEVEVTVLDWGKYSFLHKKWREMWLELGERIFHMPKWMQDIIFEDVSTAIRNRVATMEMIQEHAKRKN